MNTTTSFNDQRLDQLLHALAHTPAPVGLEQRISARLAQQSAEMHARQPSLFARILAATPFALTPRAGLHPFAIASAALILLAAACTLFITRTRPQQLAQQQARAASPQQESIQPQTAARTLSHARTLRTLQPHLAVTGATQSPQDDPDTIALAETLAPSRPAPPLPLTTQEALLLRATRRGQPIEVAELDTLRESALSSIEGARQHANLLGYIHGLLGPLAIAESLTPPTSQLDDSQSVADKEPPSSK